MSISLRHSDFLPLKKNDYGIFWIKVWDKTVLGLSVQSEILDLRQA
jgi:hypothetical protein